MIENYQEEQELLEEQEEPADQHFATVAGVYSDGLTLTFDGASGPSSKRYKCNTFVKFAAGDRVFLMKDSGTYVVVCKIGNPASSIIADSADTADKALAVGEYGTELPITFRIQGYAIEYMGGDGVWRRANQPRDENSPQNNYVSFRVNTSGNLQFYSSRYGTWKTLANA